MEQNLSYFAQRMQFATNLIFHHWLIKCLHDSATGSESAFFLEQNVPVRNLPTLAGSCNINIANLVMQTQNSQKNLLAN